MRVSTGMIFDAGVTTIQRQTAMLLRTQQQVATGRRVLTPSDDPVAAARALEVTQSREINAQYRINQDNARTALGLVDTELASANDLLQAIHERAVQAGNASLSSADLASLAKDLRARFDQLLGIANATDGTGLYLFSGYQGGVKPFSGTVEAGVAYQGDDGQRLLQVSGSRQLAVSDSGSDVFLRARNGNGIFAVSAGAGNTGAGLIDGGNPLGTYDGHSYTLTFASGGAGLEYTVDDYDPVAGTTVTTGPFAFQSGVPIQLGGGALEVTIGDTPAAGDTFRVEPSTTQSIFDTVAAVILALESAGNDPAGRARLNNVLGRTYSDLQQAMDNLLAVRASVGSRLSEADALSNLVEERVIQYETTLSRLQDLDYAEAITRLTQEQTNLEAAQKSFLRVAGLSLFNYI
jgi:flagellar hook-associated protein 3 FlgL